MVEQWMGISIDEATRMKPAAEVWLKNRYPLVEADLSRTDCQTWLAEHHPDIPVGKSSCVGCPYHSDRDWERLAREHPVEFGRAVEIDRRLRTEGHNSVQGEAFLHAARVPLDVAVARSASAPSLFDEECEGMCFL